VLHEVGHGVERNLATAARLYGEVSSSRLDGPAQLGLLRLSFKATWERERQRWRQALIAAEDSQRAGRDDITIQTGGDRLGIVVTDQSGRRVFSGYLDRGQPYRPPRDRTDLIAWINADAEAVQIRVGSHLIALPPDIRGYRIPLNPVVVKRRGSLLVKGSDGFTEQMLKKSRIQITAITDTNVYIHDDNHEIGFGRSLYSSSRLQVPNVPLTLELRPHTEASSIEILIDGKHALKLSAGRGCLVTLRLDPEQPKTARSVGAHPKDCRGWKEDDRAIVRIVSSDGNPLGHIRKVPNETVPGVIAGFIRAAWDAAFMSLASGGQWDALLRARRIYLDRAMRLHGPIASKR
jgi:hypothetical protein